MTSTPAALAHVAPPADADHVEPWIDETGSGTTWARYVRGTRLATAGVEVVVVGWAGCRGHS